MSTTIHVPPELLDAVDRRAKELGLSRNRYILRALERALQEETEWSPRLRDELAAAEGDSASRQLLGELVEAVASSRTRKPPRQL